MVDCCAGLKKVTDDMKTKNRADRSGAVPAGSVLIDKEVSSPAAAASIKTSKPKFELEGRK